MSDLSAVGIAFLLLAGNTFFVGAEFALISARRTQIEPLARRGSKIAKLTLRAMEQLSLMMAGAQLGITMCSLGLGAIGEPAVAHLLSPVFELVGFPDAVVAPLSFTIALAVVVTLHMVLGEMVPKNFALATPERAALLLGPPLYAVVWILRPLIAVLNTVANGVLRMLRVQPQAEVTSTFTAEEVAGFLSESRREGLLDDEELTLLTGALAFNGASIRQVALPLADIVTVPRQVTVRQLEELCGETGFSRFPVKGGTGDLLGYVHLKDLLSHPVQRREETVPGRYVRPLVTVEVQRSLGEALASMQAGGAHVARVVDPQDGRVVGLAFLEDVLEELVGEVIDHEAA